MNSHLDLGNAKLYLFAFDIVGIKCAIWIENFCDGKPRFDYIRIYVQSI